MRAVGVLPGKREVRLLDHPAPVISKDNEIRVKSLEVGVCGTDKEICTFVYGSPPVGFDYLVIGHESLGQVVEVGAGVRSLKPGDLVVPSVRRPCAHENCRPCRNGQQDFCSTGDFTERGIKMKHGYMTEFYVDQEQYMNPVPAALRDVGVLVEPLTVAEKAITQIWKTQARLPWVNPTAPDSQKGMGLRAVVLGAGPIGILGAMTLVINGFETYVYSRSKKPNPKAELVESFGATYISSETETVEQLAERVGNIDLVYEGLGVAKISFNVMKALGTNGIFVFTGIPAPKPAIPVDADQIMRNIVLKNQDAFKNAIRDLGVFMNRWPDSLKALITGRHSIEDYKDLLLTEEKHGIKNVITMG